MRGCLALLALLGFTFLACSFSNITFAQEEQETELSFGTVSSISSQQIVTSEYDYEIDEQVDSAYTLGPDVTLYNVNSLEEIAVGDYVWIDYVFRDGKKAAVTIDVRTSSGEEEYGAEETYEQGPYNEEYTSELTDE